MAMQQIGFQDALQASTTQQARLGVKGMTPNGNVYVYVKDSGSGFTAGNVVVPAAVTTVGTTISSSTDALGRIVFITKASAGWTVGQFEDGWVYIDNGTGEGQVAQIKTNTVDTLELFPAYALGTALSTDSTMKIWTQYLVRKSLVTTKVQNATGVAQVTTAASSYAWVLKEGIGRVLAGEVLVIGESFVTGDDTAGQVVKGTTAKGGFDEQIIGIAIAANTNADKGVICQVTL